MGILSFPENPESLADHFGGLEDPRIERSKQHALLDFVVPSICGIVCRAEGWIAIEHFVRDGEDWLRKLIPLHNGIPSHDTIGRVFSALYPERRCGLVQRQRAMDGASEFYLGGIDSGRGR